MSVLLKNAVRIASIVSVSMKVAQLALTLKETMVDIHTKKEIRRKNTIRTMLTSVMCATCGKRKDVRSERANLSIFHEIKIISLNKVMTSADAALAKAAGESETISQPHRGARRNAETTEATDSTHSAVRKG